ncbi:MAG: hypothetical protein P8L79_15615 [Rhodospirillaceae bacterium]|jgi:hypothetical protein|nr:hypothetical protein [Rhodospirillaceae bacterium]
MSSPSVVLSGSQSQMPSYSFSPAKPLELKLYGGEEMQSAILDTPGAIARGCNIHDNMIGYIYVLETDLFGKTGDDGTVTFASLAEGIEAEAQVWHHRLRGPTPRTSKLLSGGQSVVFEIGLKPDRRKQDSRLANSVLPWKLCTSIQTGLHGSIWGHRPKPVKQYSKPAIAFSSRVCQRQA